MVYDYPWYGKSDWFPSINTISNFSQTFYEYMKEYKKIKDDDLIIWWYSIWTVAWVDFASKNYFDKIILFSSLSSRYDMSSYYFWFPIQRLFFIRDSFISKKIIKDIPNDTLIIHWNIDSIVPFNQWEKVFKNSISNKKYFIELDDIWHNNIIETYGSSLENIIKQFISGEKNKYISWNYLKIDNWNKVILEEEVLVDLYTDNSIQKFVTSDLSFDDKSYVPDNLVSISSDYIYDAKWWYQLLRVEAKEALDDLSKEFYERFWIKLTVVSAYRSYIYQKGIKDRWCPDNLCAKAWFSEHQSGLAVDLFEASSNEQWKNNYYLNSYYNWLDENAHLYGFHNTYQFGLEIDWYEIEPWHWRYLWVELSTYLKDKNMTIAQYYELEKNVNLVDSK